MVKLQSFYIVLSETCVTSHLTGLMLQIWSIFCWSCKV